MLTCFEEDFKDTFIIVEGEKKKNPVKWLKWKSQSGHLYVLVSF